jgi:hypothetical protein
MNITRFLSRIIVGSLFVFSGTIKAIDPLGTVYKLQEYFQVFGIEFLKPTAFILTVILCTAEFTAGFSILFSKRQNKGIWLVMLMMSVFTPLTFILALTNPVSDCGCFGDAIKLTNWQTFAKNIIILIPAIYLFVKRGKDISEKRFREWFAIGSAAIIFTAFIIFNKTYLPVIDFLPYKKGTHIPSKMVIPPDAPVNRYETTFIYEQDGVRKEFTLGNYPSGDTSWKFIEQRSVLISKGYQPPIHDFKVTSAQNNVDITDMILSSKDYILLMVSEKLKEADRDHIEKGYSLGRSCPEKGIGFYILTSSGTDEVNGISNGLNFCLADETTLKTMVRANPGYILLKEGTIIGKWSWANVPDLESIEEMINK